MAAERDEREDDAPHTPLLDPRLAGAGGMLIAAAALAFMLGHGARHEPPPEPIVSVSAGASR